MIDESLYYAPGMPVDDKVDHSVRATALKGHIKAVAIRSTEIVREAKRIHNTSSAATAALGRFITGSLLLADNMKNEEDTQTTIIKSNGPMKGMTCVCDANGHARAYPIEGDVETTYYHPGKINVAAAVGEGSLTVIRDIGLREPYVGTIELYTSEIAEDFTYYLAVSEQTPSVVALGVLLENGEVKHAGGMMVQLMPGATEEDIDYLEKRVNGGFPEITFLMEENLSPAKILDMFIGDSDICFLSGREVSFKCTCSKERMSSGIATLPRKDLVELTMDPNGIDTECHFCGSKYHFGQDDIKNLLENM